MMSEKTVARFNAFSRKESEYDFGQSQPSARDQFEFHRKQSHPQLFRDTSKQKLTEGAANQQTKDKLRMCAEIFGFINYKNQRTIQMKYGCPQFADQLKHKLQLVRAFDLINIKRLRRLFQDSSAEELKLKPVAVALLRPLIKRSAQQITLSGSIKNDLDKEYASLLIDLAQILNTGAAQL